ncbi:hypothetical protein Tco_1388330, partial [Tanacetum coccineum]
KPHLIFGKNIIFSSKSLVPLGEREGGRERREGRDGGGGGGEEGRGRGGRLMSGWRLEGGGGGGGEELEGREEGTGEARGGRDGRKG